MTSIQHGNFDVDSTLKIDEIWLRSTRGFFCTRCFRSFIFYHFLLWKPILSLSGTVLTQCNFNDIDIITDIGTTGTTSFGNFATKQIIMNKDNFYLLQNNTNKNYNANVYKPKIIHIFFKITLTKVSNATTYMCKQFYISSKTILNKRFLLFKTQGLYCLELIFCKWVNLQKPRY